MRRGQNISIAIIFGLLACIVAYQSLGKFDDRASFAFFLLPFGLICLVPAVVKMSRGQFDPFELPVFMNLMYFLLFGLLSLPLLDPAVELYGFLQQDFRWLNVALLYLSIGLILLWVGYNSNAALWLEKAFALNKKLPLKGLTQRVKVPWIIIFYAVGMAPRFYLMSKGTYGYLKAQYLDVAEAQLPYAQWLSQATMLSNFALVLAAILFFTRPGFTARVTFYSLAGAELVLAFVSGFRTPFFFVFLYIVITYFYLYRKISWRYIMAGVILLLFVFPLVPIYRDLISTGQIEASNMAQVLSSAGAVITNAVEQGGFVETVRGGTEAASAHMSRIQDLASAIKFGTEQGLYPDRSNVLLLPALIIVPRAVWPTKPRLELGYWFYREVLGGVTLTSNATTFPGGLFLYFGFWGYLVAMFLMGVLQRFVYRRYSLENSLSAVFFSSFLVIAIGLPDSDFIGSLGGLFWQFILMMLVSKIAFAEVRVVPSEAKAPGALPAGIAD